MDVNDPSFVSWEEHIIRHERGNRVTHFYLKGVSGDVVLAVIGTERSVRHMTYVVSDDFIQFYDLERSVNVCRKWRARREVVEWLDSLVSRHRVPYSDISNTPTDSRQALGSLEVSMAGRKTCFPDHMVPRKLKVQNSDIVWSGVAWICAKQLKHYPAFDRNGTTIAVHSFVFIMGEEGQYLGYLEDIYEDKKGLKKVKVRWFLHNKEVEDLIPQLNPHPREVFITPHVQVISAECIDGPATVLTPKHYEKFVSAVAPTSPGIHMCFRQFRNNKIKPFTLPKLCGYSNQAILSSLDCSLVPKQKLKRHKLHVEDEEEFAHDDSVRVGSKRNRSHKEHQGPVTGSSGVRNSLPRNQLTKCEPNYPKLKLRFSRKMMGIKIVEPQVQCPVSFKVDEKIELLCQDSGIRGCWFRCKILQASEKRLKVHYNDVQDADESGNLEEWVLASRVAAPDKLGMRCSGRLTIRPRPPEDFTDCTLEVGAAVDAWWSDGWWEGVITGFDTSGNDAVHVYFPGEDKFLKLKRTNLRTSRDWVGNRWVDIKPKPDILSYLSENVSPSLKLSMCSTSAEASECGGSALLEPKVFTTPKLEAVEEDKQASPNLAIHNDLLEKMKGVNFSKQSCSDDEDEDGDNNNNGDLDSANQRCD
ncbi:uncharacterized protein LOC126726910 isoform X2 [Quercus robur]|uniref:uncharacterized protein LOC126726910 isoform X2 n=1 Tax=Quercus robur TaxID=38942 RepID=UPI002161444A|nr:uncharacterized protein LOC126726910 isoform X2 [Quercus robur]